MSDQQRSNLSVHRERAVLVKAEIDRAAMDGMDPLAELRALAKAAGAVVVDAMTQKLQQINAKTYVGRGKTQELAERVKAANANLVIFDNDLAPGQIREIEKIVLCKIIDRSELILDIFASRARTNEAKLQVELAQLEYTAPRLRGMWTHLERIAGAGGGTGVGAVGGIGTRGPGERQIEIDRRIVRDRVSALKRDIAAIDRRKMRTVQSRSDCFAVSLVGYTNSGKSTLLNALTGAEQFAADMLFATLDTKTVRWRIEECGTVLLSDTVGFVRDLPHRLVASFRATLEEALHAQLMLHVIDASDPSAWKQITAVESVLAELGCHDVPVIIVLNKMDAVTDPASLHLLESRLADPCKISALSGAGLDDLTNRVRRAASSNTLTVTLRIPLSEGKLIASIDTRARVLDRRFTNDAAEFDVVIDRTYLNQLTGRHPDMVVSTHDVQAAAAALRDAP